jgi:hypothetical protein
MRALCAIGLKKGISAKAVLRGWEVLVRPILEYGSEIWGEKKWKEGEDLQIEMGRRVLGVSRMTTREVIQGELGLQSIMSRRILLRIKFWMKIIKMNPNRLVYKMYKQRRGDLIKGNMKDKSNWCFWTWKFLKDLHLELVWQSENIPNENENHFINLVRELIYKKEESEWQNNIHKKTKLRTYIKLKSELKLEEYIIDFERRRRRHLTMLRGGTNKLRIERGRWVGELENERVCQVCSCDEVEDETHFLLFCSRYVRERVEMFERIKSLDFRLDDIERRENDIQLDILIGRGWKDKTSEIREVVLEYMRKADKERRKFIR